MLRTILAAMLNSICCWAALGITTGALAGGLIAAGPDVFDYDVHPTAMFSDLQGEQVRFVAATDPLYPSPSPTAPPTAAPGPGSWRDQLPAAAGIMVVALGLVVGLAMLVGGPQRGAGHR